MLVDFFVKHFACIVFSSTLLVFANHSVDVLPCYRFALIDASKCSKKDIICINQKKDIMPLILENCQLELVNDEFGTKYSTTYNIGLLEKKVCIIKCIIACNLCDEYTEILLLFVIFFITNISA